MSEVANTGFGGAMMPQLFVAKHQNRKSGAKADRASRSTSPPITMISIPARKIAPGSRSRLIEALRATSVERTAVD